MKKKKTKKRKLAKKIKSGKSFIAKLFIIIVFGIGGYYGYSYFTSDIYNIKQGISELSELRTVEYIYQELIYAENSVLFGLSTAEFAMKYTGSIEAAIDMEDIKIEKDSDNNIVIKLPKPFIASNTVNSSSKEVILDEEGIMTSVDNNAVQNKIKELQKIKEKSVRDQLFRDASNNAEQLLKGIIVSTVPSVKIKFERSI